MPIVEFYRFPASNAFIADQSIAKHLLDILKGTKGQMECYYGLQLEDNKTGFLVLVWESYEHSVNLKNEPSYLTFTEAFKSLHTEGPQSQIHVLFDGDTTPVFKAPLTEFTLINPKEGVTSTVEERRGTLDIILTKLKVVKGSHGAISGIIRGDSDTFAAVLGWDSLSRHLQVVAMDELKLVIGDFKRIANPVPAHVKLTRHD